MSDEKKQKLLAEPPAKRPVGFKLVEKDVEMNPELLAAKARKFVMPSTDESSKAWQELSITKAYAKLNQEDAKDRWKGWSQGMQGFNAHARELMKKDDMPGQKSVCAPRSDTVVVQPYQESVSWLVHPLSLPNPRLLVVHRTGAGVGSTAHESCPPAQSARVDRVARGRQDMLDDSHLRQLLQG